MTAAAQPARYTIAHKTAHRDELITGHVHLVTSIAARMQKSVPVHIELDDLIHAGTMGLLDAASKYSEDKDVLFPTYAKHRIRGAILDSLRQQDWASRDLRKRFKQMEALKLELAAKLGRTPADKELADAMGLDAKRWQALMVDFRNVGAAAAQARVVEDENHAAAEVPAAPAQAPDRLFART